ncbi:MAG: STAS domain-containing protein [gamma proteobacterium symbiont of Taylorina sp.]|nr:STAS domain-containing protein [gamma proteobacterium symbiont of Taylorina sp.]
MDSAQFETISAGHFRIKGELNFQSVPELWLQNKEELFNEQDRILEIDFSQLNRSDSSGLALLLEWYREAEQKGKKITFINLPEQMIHMAEVCGLDDVLPLKIN